jgi:uncharacterized glyoxalase superfamily protein PhnB
MHLEPYVFFHGRCEEALEFYRECLRGEIVGLSRFAGSPMESNVSPDFKDKVMHASFVAGDVKFMASDGRPGSPPTATTTSRSRSQPTTPPRASAFSRRWRPAERFRCR